MVKIANLVTLDIEAIDGGKNADTSDNSDKSDTSDNSGAAIGNPYLGKTFAKGLKEKAPSTKNRLSELKIIMFFFVAMPYARMTLNF